MRNKRKNIHENLEGLMIYIVLYSLYAMLLYTIASIFYMIISNLR